MSKINVNKKCPQKGSQKSVHKKFPQKVSTKNVHKKCIKRCPQKVSTENVHKKCPHKVSTKNERGTEGDRKGSDGERQGRGRWAAGNPAILPHYAADCDLDPSTMSGKDQKKQSAWQFSTISVQKLQNLRLMSCLNFSLRNLFAVDRLDLQHL